MSSVAKRRLEAVSQQLVEGIPDAGTFENIPKIKEVAQDSVGPYVSPLPTALKSIANKFLNRRVKGKVVIVTGTQRILHSPMPHHDLMIVLLTRSQLSHRHRPRERAPIRP